MRLFTDEIKLSAFSEKVADLARANRFIVNITNADESIKFFIIKATIPQIDITGPEIGYFGTKAMIAGDSKIEPLILGFLNDTEWKIRKYFEDWTHNIKSYNTNIQTAQPLNGDNGYRVGKMITINQIGSKDEVIASYVFNHAIPLLITSIELDMNSENTTEAFDVTFYYTHFERKKL